MRNVKSLIIILLLLINTQCHYRKNREVKHKLNFYTQYNQFYIASSNSALKDLENSWNDDAYEDRLDIFKNTLLVHTECYGDVKGELVLLEKANDNIDFELYDHIVEGGINVKSGVLQVLDCPNGSLEYELKVTPGNYRIRVYSSNLSSVIESDLANETDNDFYKIEVWPDENMERKVLKKYIRK